MYTLFSLHLPHNNNKTMTDEQKAFALIHAIQLGKKQFLPDHRMVVETTIWTDEELEILKTKLLSLTTTK